MIVECEQCHKEYEIDDKDNHRLYQCDCNGALRLKSIKEHWQPVKQKPTPPEIPKGLKVVLFIILLPIVAVCGIVTFPIGTIGGIGLLVFLYQKWFKKEGDKESIPS